MLTETQIERYSRQIILPEVGGRGQEKLLSANVAIVGTGALAHAAAFYLAAAGIGRLAVAAVESIASALTALNPDCRTTTLPADVTADTAASIAREHDVVIVGNAEQQTSNLLNAASVARRTPLVWGNAAGAVGHVTTFTGHQTAAPCFQCLPAQPQAVPPRGAVALAGMVAAFIGTLQATEAIKTILGMETGLAGRMLIYDALTMDVREVRVAKDPQCPACGVA